MRHFFTALLCALLATTANAQVMEITRGKAYVGELITGSGAITFSNGESINTSTDDSFDFTRDDSGTVTLTSSDDDATANMTIDPGGTATLTLGSSADTVTVAATSGLTFSGAESINNATAATFDFTRDDAGIVTLTCSDDDATAGCTYDAGGASPIVVGSGDVTSITLTTDGGSVIVDGSLDGVAPAGITGTPATTGIWTFTRDAAGIVTITAADDDATAALTIDPGGAAALTLGSADVTAVTVTTDGTGTAEVALPAGSIDGTEILDGTINAADEAYAGRAQIVICGDLTTINNNTVYYGPNRAVTAAGTSGMTCDVSAAGNTTEATADAPAFEAQAFHVRAMVCRTVDTGETVSFTLRTAEGATTPSVTCSIADNELDCVADVQTTTQIASAATIAVAAASTGDLGTAAFVCTLDVVF